MSTSRLLTFALQYASKFKWKLIPCHYITNGKCSCGNPNCGTNSGKHPIFQKGSTEHGIKSASNDLEVIKQWWTKHPKANIGLATGKESGVIVVDVDTSNGKNGQQTLDLLKKKYPKSWNTLQSVTGSGGYHYFYAYPDDDETTWISGGNDKLGEHIDVKADGGNIILPPSVHYSKGVYKWLDKETPIKQTPVWMLTKLNSSQSDDLQDSVVENNSKNTTRLEEILAYIPNDDYSTWVKVGMALHNSGHDLSLWEQWSQTSSKYSAGICQRKWNSFGKSNNRSVTERSIYGLAKSYGWSKKLEESIITDDMLKYLRGFVHLRTDKKFIELSTGDTIDHHTFDCEAETAFPNQWPKAKPHLTFFRENGISVRRCEYHPGKPSLLIQKSEKIGVKYIYNEYKYPDLPFPVRNKKHEKMFIEHIKFISDNDDVFTKYFLDWMAYLVRNPGKIIRSSPLIIGKVGTGKTFFFKLFSALLGRDNITNVTTQELLGEFEGGFCNAQLRICDEVKVHESQLTLMEKLKAWITNDDVKVNDKHKKQIDIYNKGSWLFLSNHEDALRFNNNERRYAAAISRMYCKDPSYYITLFETFIPDSGGSVASIYYYLKHRDISKFNPNAPAPTTEASKAVANNTRSALEEELFVFLHNKQGCFNRDLVTFHEIRDAVKDAAHKLNLDKGKISNSVILKTCTALNIQKISDKQIRINVQGESRLVDLYCVRNTKYWLTDIKDDKERNTKIRKYLAGSDDIDSIN